MAKVTWHGDKVVKQVEPKIDKGLRQAATIVEKHVKRKFKQRTYGTGTGALYNAIKTRKSKYEGWIVGVFDKPTERWVDSLGARAIFFEFGRAGKGHRSRDTARGKRERQAAKVQPPRPFFRPGLRNSRHEIRRKLGLKVR